MLRLQIRQARFGGASEDVAPAPGHEKPLAGHDKTIDYAAVGIFLLWCALLLIA